MSRPDGVTGCESDEISQKVCLGDAVGASDLQMLDAPFFQNRIPGFCADAQYLAHLVDVQHVRVIPEHHTVRITGIQVFFAQIILLLYTNSCNGVQREHNKKLNNGLPILHKVPPKRDYGRYFCIMAEKGGTSHGGLTEKLSPFFHAKKQEVNAYGR